MTFEHEALHAETLLYMLLQRAGTGTVPPAGFIAPNWEALSTSWEAASVPKEVTITLGPTTISLGHDDNEEEDLVAKDVKEHEFGWDNEHPKVQVEVGEFRIEWRPITNGQFYEFYKGYQGETPLEFPGSWVKSDNGEIRVRFSLFYSSAIADFCSGSHIVRPCSIEDRTRLACDDIVQQSLHLRYCERRKIAYGTGA